MKENLKKPTFFSVYIYVHVVILFFAICRTLMYGSGSHVWDPVHL